MQLFGVLLIIISSGFITLSEEGLTTYVSLITSQGELYVEGVAANPLYEIYFHIPVPYEYQVPIFLEVEGMFLVDYRFVRLIPPNLVVAATVTQGRPCQITWKASVLVLDKNWGDIPSFVPIPDPGQLPDSVTKWLQPTDCAQIESPVVQAVASEVLGTTNNLITLADSIYSYCHAIPYEFPHYPTAFDAVYALLWGNSCTGRAHAAAALFRANNVPARTLMNTILSESAYDQHWAIDYYVPNYGWVRMDPSLHLHPHPTFWEVVTMVCNPEDEFPIWFLRGCEAAWHTSDPTLLRDQPNWGGAHSARFEKSVAVSDNIALYARILTEDVFQLYVDIWSLPLSTSGEQLRELAYNQQQNARDCFLANDFSGYIQHMENALGLYQSIGTPQIVTVFQDDFESGSGGWTHGGTLDEWELGTPQYGPSQSHSGSMCWGTDLDSDYESNADNWLLSPPIELSDNSSAFLDFWIWNWIEEFNDYDPVDRIWVEITTEGSLFEPICSAMAGINDDPEIPDVGGWSHVVLDIQRFTGNTVQFRFRLSSNSTENRPGSYIDDVIVYERLASETGITSPDPVGVISITCTPNPCTKMVSIDFILGIEVQADLAVYDCSGRLVASIKNVSQNGNRSVTWNCTNDQGRSVPAGLYFVHIEAGDRSASTRMVVLP